jgi:RNA polymerase sigma-70 factor, ECF subfamily
MTMVAAQLGEPHSHRNRGFGGAPVARARAATPKMTAERICCRDRRAGSVPTAIKSHYAASLQHGSERGAIRRLRPGVSLVMARLLRSAANDTDRPSLEVIADSDADLLCRVGERDLQAFEALYRRYARPLYALALRRLRDPGRAEDAVQEAFTAVWRSAATYRPERGPAAPWLFRVAHNTVIDAHRASGRDRAHPVGDPPETPAPDASPDESAEQAWVAFCVHAAVAELPERERVPLELAYWHGQSQSEVARQLGLPIGTVKTRTRSGLARLAARLEGTL